MASPDARATASAAGGDPDPDPNPERELRRYLLLLASLAATVTYAAGLDPPGGSWVESDGRMAVAGDPILRATHHPRYLAFYYSNATAFAASLVVILLLLLGPERLPSLLSSVQEWLVKRVDLSVLRLVMVLDMLALMAAYTAGSCRDMLSTIYTVALVIALFAYVGIHILKSKSDILKSKSDPRPRQPRPALALALALAELEERRQKLEQRRKVLMLLAIFAATITYDAGLKPPGGFWEHTDNGGGLHGRPGEVILKHKHGGRFTVFFFCNTTAFIASLLTVVLLLDKKLTPSAKFRLRALSAVVVVTLVTLVAAYSAGSCRKTATTAYTVTLVALVLVSIFLAAAGSTSIIEYLPEGCCPRSTSNSSSPGTHSNVQEAGSHPPQSNNSPGTNSNVQEAGCHPPQSTSNNRDNEPPGEWEEMRSLVLLLGTLAASITYQAGLNPPGGVWLENQAGSDGHWHNAGDPILFSTDRKRYNTFFYCNSTALVASIVVIIMAQIKNLLKHGLVLHVVMKLDLLGLMGAYIAGSSRTLSSSMHILIMAAAFLVYVMAHALLSLASNNNSSSSGSNQLQEQENTRLKKRRKRLLLFAILVASISYQAGLSPPGGFWITTDHEQGQGGHSVGSPILKDMYPRRYQAFFYFNATSFMASMALIILLQDKDMYRPGRRCYSLYACMGVGMVALMGAYAAGSARRVRTSVYAIVLVGAVLCFMLLVGWSTASASASASAPAAGQVNIDIMAAPHNQPSPNGNTESAPPPESENNNGGGNTEALHHHQSSSNGNGNIASAAEHNEGSGNTAAVHDQSSSNANGNNNHRRNHKYVMLLAMLAASVTYKAGLDPPGGVWPDGDGYGGAAGNSVLHDRNLRRYHVFFYSNSVSFMASIMIIILLLKNQLQNSEFLLRAINPVVAVDMIVLLVAYASGSSRTMEMSMYVIALGIAVVLYIVIMVLLRLMTVSVEDDRNGANEMAHGASQSLI